jgi:hypothetical protein
VYTVGLNRKLKEEQRLRKASEHEMRHMALRHKMQEEDEEVDGEHERVYTDDDNLRAILPDAPVGSLGKPEKRAKPAHLHSQKLHNSNSPAAVLPDDLRRRS